MEGAAEDRGISLSGYHRQLAKLDLRSREASA